LKLAGISSRAFGKLENKYKFNGIEQNIDFDLNIYDAFFRNLDPQTGRFWQVDPKTTWEESPYVIMQNNPILKCDWLGDYFTYANSGVEATYNKMRKENNDKMAGYLSEIYSVLTSGEKGMGKLLEQLAGLINMHAELNSQWDEMESSAVEFNISDERTLSGSALGQSYYDATNNRINIDLKDGKDYGSLVHEIRHGYGYMIGELIGTKNTSDPLYDAMDEVVARNASYLFLDREVANNVVAGVYDVESFVKYAASSPQSVYYHLRNKKEQLALNTTAAIFLNYTSDIYLKKYINRNSGNANLTAGDALNAANALDVKAVPPRSPQYIFGDALKNKKIQ
jgi:RHS repeat-associated protein